MIISAAPLYSATRLVRGHSMDRVQTHVEGFDEALGGGIPRGSIVLVAGSPGTMKTALTFSMLYENVKAGSKALYISLEESQEDLRAATSEPGMTGLDPTGNNGKLSSFDEEFLADGILVLRHFEKGETDVQLRLRCVKMRRTRHEHGYYALIRNNGRFQLTRAISE